MVSVGGGLGMHVQQMDEALLDVYIYRAYPFAFSSDNEGVDDHPMDIELARVKQIKSTAPSGPVQPS